MRKVSSILILLKPARPGSGGFRMPDGLYPDRRCAPDALAERRYGGGSCGTAARIAAKEQRPL